MAVLLVPGPALSLANKPYDVVRELEPVVGVRENNGTDPCRAVSYHEAAKAVVGTVMPEVGLTSLRPEPQSQRVVALHFRNQQLRILSAQNLVGLAPE